MNSVEINSSQKKNDVLEFLETLEDDDDVQNIFTNLKFVE